MFEGDSTGEAGRTVRTRGERRYRGLGLVVFALAVGLVVVAGGVGTGGAVATADPGDNNSTAVVEEFTAVGTDGWVEINTEEPANPIPLTPDGVEKPIVIEGERYANGTWTSTDVRFTNLSSANIDEIPTDIELGAGSEFGGTLDRETGAMTVSGVLSITIPEIGAQITFEPELTTGESNAMEGSATVLDTADAHLRVVDNNFAIEDETGAILDDLMGLPSPERGTNWMELNLTLSFGDGQPNGTGTVEGVVETSDGNPVENATVTAGGSETTTSADGSYSFALTPGEYEVLAGAPNHTVVRQTVAVERNETQRATFELDRDFAEFVAKSVTATGGRPGEILNITGQVQNQGTETGQRPVTLSVGGDTVTEVLELAPGHRATITLDWRADAAGQYEAVLDTWDSTVTERLTVGSPSFALDIEGADVDPGETATVLGSVTNSGTAPGSTTVTVSVADQSVTETVDLAPGTQAEIPLDWETSDADEGEHQAIIETEQNRATGTVLVGGALSNESDADFLLESTGGYMTFGHDTYADAVGRGMPFPDRARETPIQILGVIDEQSGTWHSTEIFFPELRDPGMPFGGQARFPTGLEGKIDREEGFFTIEGAWHVFVDGREDTSFVFDMGMRSEATGDIPDDVAYFTMHDNDTATANLVSNNFTIENSTGDNIIDGGLNLPSTDPTQNYVELGVFIDFDPGETEINNQTEIGGEKSESGESHVAAVGQALGLVGLVGLFLVGGIGLYRRFERTDNGSADTDS